MPNKITPMNPMLAWARDMITYMGAQAIHMSTDYRNQVIDVKNLLSNDVSGIASSILDFAINCSLVDYYADTGNVNLNDKLNNWLNNINSELRGKIPVGIKALAKEYFRERWKGSSFLLLRCIWGKEDGFEVPKKMWFVDGEDIDIKNDDSETIVIGEEKYRLRLSKSKYLNLPTGKEESIFIQKPYTAWGVQYPTPFLYQRGVYYNSRLLSLVLKKGENITAKALEYLLLLKKGTERMSLEGSSDKVYGEQDLKDIKKGFQEFLDTNRQSDGTPTHVVNFDTELEHIIPDYQKALGDVLYSPIEKRILAGLGLIEIIQGTASTRRESVLNPKPFQTEVETGVSDFKTLLEDIMQVIITKNNSHSKYFPSGKQVAIHNSPVSAFMTDDLRTHIRSMYDRGSISIRTYSEMLGMDFDLEVKRRKEEKVKEYDDLMYPHITQNVENQVNADEVAPTKQKTKTPSVDKSGPESKNFKKSNIEEIELFEEASSEELELAVIVHRKDGWYVLSEKTGRNLGGPYKTKAEAVKRLQQVEWFKHKGEEGN